ncbi:hypothetical protein LTR56_024390 [Elasticomyces elasticus]|nr:hypothetical protein LTR56_024390 [Elasticomyces elasticus]KAK3622762.1 hypothetical protein LTR22_024655 [Elasticomyces elasticus]KAK4906830.1 hypothetical protein LTR49_024072 [Elasticomyces elasticus]
MAVMLKFLRLAPRVSPLPSDGENEARSDNSQSDNPVALITDTSFEDDLESQKLMARHDIQTGLLESHGVHRLARSDEQRVERTQATSPSVDCQGEQRSKRKSSTLWDNAKELQEDSHSSYHTASDTPCGAGIIST